MKKLIFVFITLLWFISYVFFPADLEACWWKGLPHGTPDTGGAPPDNPGDGQPGQPNGGEPVFLHNGDFVYTYQDLSISSKGINLEIIRTYKSQFRFNGRFGLGWELNYNKRVVPLSNGDVFYFDGEGKRQRYLYIDGKNYISPPEVFDKLVQNQDGTYTLFKKGNTRYNFNPNGTLSEIVERNNNKLTFTYNPEGKLPVIGVPLYTKDPITPRVIAYQYMLTKITDATGREIQLTYDANGRLTKIRDLTGRTITYTYDDLGHLTSVTDPAGNTIQYSYDSDRNLRSITDAKGNTYLTNTYNPQDQLIAQEYEEGTFYFSYDTEKRITKFTDQKDNIWTFYFDEQGNPIKIVDPIGNTTSSTYDTNKKMLLTSVTYPKGNSVLYEYDGRGNTIRITQKPSPDSLESPLTTTFTYDSTFNRITSITNPLGRTAYFEYDAKGNLTKITNAASWVVKYTYDASGFLTKIEDVASGDELNFAHDSNGYLTKLTAKDGNYVEYDYDRTGNITSISKNGCTPSTFTYNSVNRMVTFTDPVEGQTTISYDANGRLINITYPPGQGSLSYTYSALSPFGLLTSVTNAKGETTRFDYEYGMISSMTNSKGQTTTYTYDAKNRLSKVAYPDGSSVTYSYDPVDNVTGITNLSSLRLAYDDLRRLTSITDTTLNETTSYTYDAVGDRITRTDASGTTTYTYDNLNRLIRITHPDSSVTDLSSRPVRRYPERIILSGIANLYNNKYIDLLFWYLRGCSFSEVVSREAIPPTVGRLPEPSAIRVDPEDPLTSIPKSSFEVFLEEQRRYIDLGMY